MWTCKHCNEEFDFKTTSEKANHSRWCKSNPKRNDIENVVTARRESIDRRLGKPTEFTVECFHCKNDMLVIEREHQHPKKEKYFCSRRCANTQGGIANAKRNELNGGAHYRTIAMRYNKHECLVCGFDKILAVHHVNKNHKDDSKENLVLLCPNHHQLLHSRYEDEVLPLVKKYISDKWNIIN